jgi:hypothetical protein
MAPARKFSILLMPSWRILEQSKPGGTSGLMCCELVVPLYFCCDGATFGLDGLAVASKARETPASATNRPIKTRRLKKADCEVDFFFMRICGYEVDGV